MSPDRGLGIVLLIVSVSYTVAAMLISEPFGQYTVIGPRLVPLLIGVVWIVCSLWIAIGAADRIGLSAVDWSVVCPSALAFLVYVLVFERVGYLVATAVFIAVESNLLGSRDWRRDVIVSVGITVSVYIVFGLLLGLRLPGGFLG
ncbi:MAG: hypothetical protein CL484_11590 [Acidobacteria bacterium]|mgnify:CR=1 FL=1|nr:hypothetical protein [Acidobacteriota bacterium]